METISLSEARALALTAQGFGKPRPVAPGPADFQRVIDDVVLVQIDSVNVLERSHYLPFFARLGPYDRGKLDAYLYSEPKYVIEQWAHVASFMPIQHYGLMRHRFDDTKRYRHWTAELQQNEPGYLDGILEEVRRRGPLVVGELEDGGSRSGPWWGWGKGKIALEYQFRRGALAVRERKNFARIYDLEERVIPPAALAQPALERPEAHREMLKLGSRALGVGTARDIADYFRVPVSEAKPRIAELVDLGDLVPLKVEGWKESAYAASGFPPGPLPEGIAALLTPFDSLVWERARDERLFNFRYRIELYTPEPKRVFGYYVLPFLLGDQIVGRVDLKANRQEKTLEVRAAWFEVGADPVKTAAGLWPVLNDMARWLGLERITLSDRGDLVAALRKCEPKRPIPRQSQIANRKS